MVRALFVAFMLTAGRGTRACTTVVAGPRATVDGSTMVTGNNDCFDCDFRLAKVPASSANVFAVRAYREQYPREVSNRSATYSRYNLERDVPASAHAAWREDAWDEAQTLGFHRRPATSEMRATTFSSLEALYGIENEAGLAIGEATCGSLLWSAPRACATCDDNGGGALWDIAALSKLALRECADARCAIRVMGAAAQAEGYYGGGTPEAASGEALTLADGVEAWVFHISPDDTGRSAVWCAQRVPDDHIAAVANQYVIRELDCADDDSFLCSDSLVAVAERAGLAVYGARHGGLDWAASFSDAVVQGRGMALVSTQRVWRAFDLVAPSRTLPTVPPSGPLADE